MSHYQCPDCDEYLCSPACREAADTRRRAYWAEEFRKRQDALDNVADLIRQLPQEAGRTKALILVHKMAGRAADEALRFSQK